MRPAPDSGRENLKEVALVFGRLGATAFGGPAAHIAMMRAECVERHGWLSDAEFADLLGVTNLIPGPNSTELAIHLGFRRAGMRGLLVAGVAFIGPAFLMVLALAALYVRFGTLPDVRAALAGAKPVILAVVAQALLGLGRSVLKTPLLIAIAALAVVASLLGASELLIVFVPGLILGLRAGKGATLKPLLAVSLGVGVFLALSLILGARGVTGAPGVGPVFLQFLKIGSVLYGSGYVLLSYLQGDLVRRLGWLTSGQLLDAVAVGQFTPGPVFTTATFVGYVVGGVPGAVAATAGIFLPSFVLVALSANALSRLRGLPTTAAFLEGVNAASLGLMAAVLVKLGRDAATGPATVLVAVTALVIVLRTRVNSAWLVLAGAVLGVALGWGHSGNSSRPDRLGGSRPSRRPGGGWRATSPRPRGSG